MKPIKWLFILAIGGITAFGGYFRFYSLDYDGFWMDEAFSVQAARAIQRHGIPLFENGETSWGWLPMHYLMAASMSLPGDMHLTSRLPSVVAGTMMIPLAAWLAFTLSRSYIAALIAAFLIAFSVPDIAWSRQARGYLFIQLTGYSGVGFVFWGMTRRRMYGMIFGSILLSLAILTHRAGYIYWLISAGIMAASWWSNKKKLEPLHWASMGALLVALCIGYLLPSGSSQGLNTSLSGMAEAVPGLSYAGNYMNLTLDFFGWNILWVAVGLAGAIIYNWRLGAPLAIGLFSYLFVLSEKTLLFHVRYLLPVLPIAHIAAATGPIHILRLFGRGQHDSPKFRSIFVILLLILWVCTTLTQNLTFSPSSSYELGPTEPQADWRGAYQWVSQQGDEPVTISCLPVFHDLYLGPEKGAKYFLPFTFTSVPGNWQEKPPYTAAIIIHSFREYRAVDGYVFLDEFSFNTLKDQSVRKWLMSVPPVHVTSDASVRIWRTPL